MSVCLFVYVCLCVQMKNWKRRFFVLTELSLGYYKTLDVSADVTMKE